jgi:hypothetical protein
MSPGAFDRYLAGMGTAWPDQAKLLDGAGGMELAADLTEGERRDLLARVAEELVVVESARELRDASTEELRVLVDAGDRGACAELNRRGVEPPTLPLGPDPLVAT